MRQKIGSGKVSTFTQDKMNWKLFHFKRESIIQKVSKMDEKIKSENIFTLIELRKIYTNTGSVCCM